MNGLKNMKQFEFKLQKKKGTMRAGVISTTRGEIKTPIFMPVGTLATVKALDSQDIKNLEAQIILSNTYHLYLRPGTEILHKAGGLHKFMAWDKPILTDSGGYQVYRLSVMRKIKEEGVKYQSNIDGSYHIFSPENVIDTQR